MNVFLIFRRSCRISSIFEYSFSISKRLPYDLVLLCFFYSYTNYEYYTSASISLLRWISKRKTFRYVEANIELIDIDNDTR